MLHLQINMTQKPNDNLAVFVFIYTGRIFISRNKIFGFFCIIFLFFIFFFPLLSFCCTNLRSPGSTNVRFNFLYKNQLIPGKINQEKNCPEINFQISK